MSENDIIGPVLLLVVNSKLFWLWLCAILMFAATGNGIFRDSRYWFGVSAWTCFIVGSAVGDSICGSY